MLLSLVRRLVGSKAPGAKPARAPSRTHQKLIADCHDLMSERGDVSGTRIATRILAGYKALDAESREQFFKSLIEDFSPNPQEVGRAGDAYRSNPSAETLARLQKMVEPPRQELFRRLNIAPGGTRALVDMRADLLAGETDPDATRRAAHAQIAADLAHLLTSWFNRGFLTLERIDWRTSASVLEKLIQYEAVHQIHGWPDLRRRLAPDRRCYAFFHPALPEEPIIFVEAALTRGLSDNVQALINPDAPEGDANAADTAIFFSITNCQKGLRGVPFGSFLIKQVVEDLGRELPRVRRFATLSPVPGFRAWLDQNASALNMEKLAAQLKGLDWQKDPRVVEEVKERVLWLCSRYLLREKSHKEPLDTVARFHLRNGARLERINWMGDTSAKGLERSAGLTVNYVYRLADLEKNHELYLRESRIAASAEIEKLAGSNGLQLNPPTPAPAKAPVTADRVKPLPVVRRPA
ncbi:MAG TPA: malonyl-CoA decarboxylase [Bryobacteraceae bacterium]|jgi:malonyl-CoA decarboxylase